MKRRPIEAEPTTLLAIAAMSGMPDLELEAALQNMRALTQESNIVDDACMAFLKTVLSAPPSLVGTSVPDGAFAATADYLLHCMRTDETPSGRVCLFSLWLLSRHPAARDCGEDDYALAWIARIGLTLPTSSRYLMASFVADCLSTANAEHQLPQSIFRRELYMLTCMLLTRAGPYWDELCEAIEESRSQTPPGLTPITFNTHGLGEIRRVWEAVTIEYEPRLGVEDPRLIQLRRLTNPMPMP